MVMLAKLGLYYRDRVTNDNVILPVAHPQKKGGTGGTPHSPHFNEMPEMPYVILGSADLLPRCFKNKIGNVRVVARDWAKSINKTLYREEVEKQILQRFT
jgi:hypothetical protein